ncbi:acyclic terpene utilization AtuA family protein [Candidatus Levibacter sp. Uisw_134_01]|uniref:acyclic terpene utilization AtuA family protein n=1 Tax=Candidatus Levibacter sp. Uisw_134_01 TaxID=3230999 RepID=UPI003D4DABD1
MTITKVLVPSGVLGLGFDIEALRRGIKHKPDIISIDGGSTDSGPASLGSGTSKYSRAAIKSEWKTLMQARKEANVPLIIGTCGTCGTNSMVDWMEEITIELAKELGQSLKIAKLYCEQNIEFLKSNFKINKIFPLEPAPSLNVHLLDDLSHVVALAGAEQVIEAINTGADIILGGRTTDTAIISALPLMNGVDPGSAWHGAKIAECGALCSSNPTSGVVLVEFDKTCFNVEAMSDSAICSPETVSAHMLYENADPYILYEPGGYMDVTNACYQSINSRKVRVEGSLWVSSKKYTVKLEGARVSGYQTSLLVLLRDNDYVKNAIKWTEKLSIFLSKEIKQRMNLDTHEYSLNFRHIGLNAVLGDLEKNIGNPREVGVLCIITSKNPNVCTEIAKLINPFLLHFPLTVDEELPTFAFPYSPVHSDRGCVYEFALHHVLELNDPMDAFQIKTLEV